MDEDADDLERLVRKGIRRVRLEDDAHAHAHAHARAHATQPTHSTVLHTTVSHTVVSHATSARVADPPHAPASAHKADRKPAHAAPTVVAAQHSNGKPAHSSFTVSPTPKLSSTGGSYARLLLVLLGSAFVYLAPVIVRTLFLETETEVGLYQYLLTILYFTWLLETRYLSHPQTSTHSPQTTASHPLVKQCDVITLLKIERETLKANMAVCVDRQYSFYHYPHFHIPLSTILHDIDMINQELMQIELLILKLDSGNFEKEYDPILAKVLNKYGVK
jgi:hypothetical protein